MARPVDFSQIISVRTDHPERAGGAAEEWDDLQSTVDVMGYTGRHVLADRDDPGRYLVVAEFASVDPDVPGRRGGAAQQRSPRDPGVGAQPHRARHQEPVFTDYDEIYRTSY